MEGNFFSLQDKEYKIEKKWKVFIWIIVPPLIASFVWLGFVPFLAKQFNWVVFVILVPTSIVITLWFVYMFLDSVSYRFAIKDGKFTYRSLLLRRSIDFDDVRGYRIDDNYIRVEPKGRLSKEIKLSKYTQDAGEIMEFLRTHFEALDHTDAAKEQADILSNNEYGITEESRLSRLKQAKIVARVVNATGIGICLWLFLKPVPYDMALYSGVAFPFLVLGVLMHFRGLIKLDEKKGSKYPSVTYGYILACCGLVIRVLDFELVDYLNLWIYSIIPALGMLLLFRMAVGKVVLEKFLDYVSIFSLAAILVFYSVCGYTVLNCLPDQSKPAHFTAKVLEKTVSKGKTTTYYILLTPWGPRTESKKVSITRSEYDRAEVGEEVQIFLKSGLLNLPWFYIDVN
ncbi:MAG TPA: hypothetical protein VK589_02950 [Chryseolinea sp.]|nr:hypothetical protein [Chryseolinea sp.]